MAAWRSMSTDDVLDAVEDALDQKDADREVLARVLADAYQAYWDERGEEPSISNHYDSDLERFEVLFTKAAS